MYYLLFINVYAFHSNTLKRSSLHCSSRTRATNALFRLDMRIIIIIIIIIIITIIIIIKSLFKEDNIFSASTNLTHGQHFHVIYSPLLYSKSGVYGTVPIFLIFAPK